jgi:hypothetical protein
MGWLRFESLIGILACLAEKKLTPISSDVFVSIPDRDFIISSVLAGESLRLISRITDSGGHYVLSSPDVFN